jgi:acyl-CoA thioesterase I
MIAKNRGLLVAALGLAACSSPRPSPRASPGTPAEAATATPAPAASDAGRPDLDAPVTHDRPAIVFLGTSLTAGFGLDVDEAYPALVQKKLDAAGLRYRVVNAGVSGETSAGALRRLDWIFREPVAVLVVETGANDALRGQDPDATRANIQAIFDRARKQTPPPKLVLVGMEALPNYGAEYGRRFRAIFPELARKNGATLVPFLLEGVAGVRSLNQPDGVHPTAAGQERVAETVWKTLRPVLAGDAAQGGRS